jgi:hypothetical protein
VTRNELEKTGLDPEAISELRMFGSEGPIQITRVLSLVENYFARADSVSIVYIKISKTENF